METAVIEAQSSKTLQTELDDVARSLMSANDMGDVSLETVSSIEYTANLSSDQPDQHELEFTYYPSDHITRVGFWHDGEMHGMYFRFKRGRLESADRTTNGYQPCQPDREDWFRHMLSEIKANADPSAMTKFSFHYNNSAQLRF